MKTRFVVLFLAACSGSGGGAAPDAQSGDTFDRTAMLANLGTAVIVPAFERFDTSTDGLATEVASYCAALGSPAEPARRGAAQLAWQTAMDRWQETTSVAVGPADAMTLRERIYSWPVVSSCAVDQEVMARATMPGSYDISTKLTNRRGLPALEYLLFAASLESTCPTAPAGWNALSEADRRAARCAYAADAAEDLATQAQALLDGWRPYATTLANAGAPGNPFRSPHEAVNRVSDGLFYLDTDVKDMKIGEPAGITQGSCGTLGAPCPQDLESPWSTYSKENILADLRSFRAIFDGGAGMGFDDFLAARGAATLATQIQTDLDASVTAVEAIPGNLGDAIITAPDEVAAAFAAVKKVTDELKSQFLTTLALELPEGLGDDGD